MQSAIGTAAPARVHMVYQTPDGPELSCIEPWLRDTGYRVTTSRPCLGEPPPAPETFDLLIVMGGPMGVGDTTEHPWLRREKRWLEQVLSGGGPVLGICLGAQLLAELLGARVYPAAQPERGWWPVTTTPQARGGLLGSAMGEQMRVFHSHGDTFDLPPGATHLARSAACEQQAFALGDRVLGLQFHLEATPAFVDRIAARYAARTGTADVAAGPALGPWEQPLTELAGNAAAFAAGNAAMARLLANWLARINPVDDPPRRPVA